MSEALINKGITIVGERKNLNSTIVVVGTARGGTSMIAGVLAKLGVFMGDRSVSPVYEDVRLSEAFEARDLNTVKLIVDEYSSRYDQWGWKRPSSINYLDMVNEMMGSPSFVFVFKDVLSISQRNEISMLSEVLPGIDLALKQYSGCLDFLKRKSVHAMLVSYDKIIRYPKFFVLSLCEFYNLSPDPSQLHEAISFIRPNPVDYLDASRITKAQGVVDRFNDGNVHGWARYVHSKNHALVDFFINDELVGSEIADKCRPDLGAKFGQCCAFRFRIPDGVILSKSNVLRVRVRNEVNDLKNSPINI